MTLLFNNLNLFIVYYSFLRNFYINNTIVKNMDKKSTTINYPLQDVVLTISLSSSCMEIEGVLITTQQLFANTFEENTLMKFAEIYDHIAKGLAIIEFTKDKMIIKCAFIKFELSSIKKDDLKLLIAEIALLKTEINNLKNKKKNL